MAERVEKSWRYFSWWKRWWLTNWWMIMANCKTGHKVTKGDRILWQRRYFGGFFAWWGIGGYFGFVVWETEERLLRTAEVCLAEGRTCSSCWNGDLCQCDHHHYQQDHHHHRFFFPAEGWAHDIVLVKPFYHRQLLQGGHHLVRFPDWLKSHCTYCGMGTWLLYWLVIVRFPN